MTGLVCKAGDMITITDTGAKIAVVEVQEGGTAILEQLSEGREGQ